MLLPVCASRAASVVCQHRRMRTHEHTRRWSMFDPTTVLDRTAGSTRVFIYRVADPCFAPGLGSRRSVGAALSNSSLFLKSH